MKRNEILVGLKRMGILAVVTLGLQWQAPAQLAEADMSVADRIEAEAAFLEPIQWVGSPPTEAESRVLWNLLTLMRESGPMEGLPWLEKFAVDNPRSPWTPSLQANLAWHYRRTGLYTRALELWEAAWPALRNEESGIGVKVRSFALAQWMNLLTSLGRVDRLVELIEENGDNPLDGGSDYQLYVRAVESTRTMVKYPEIAFQCGNFAVARIALEQGRDEATVTEIREIPSPDTGFSMLGLSKIIGDYGIDLVPMRRTRNNELVAPAVIHWKSDHYAALIAVDGPWCLVVDPTFGQPKWLRTDYVNEEASGEFFVPRDHGSPRWEAMTDEETARVFGRGYPNGVDNDNGGDCPDDEDADKEESDENAPINGENPNQGQGCEECPPGGGGGDSGSGEPCEDEEGCDVGCKGMATWNITEPYITLWVTDTPLYYTKPDGKVAAFTLSYKQHNNRSISYTYGFGELWDANFLNYVENDSGPVSSGGGADYVKSVNAGSKQGFSVDGTTRHFYTRETMSYDSGASAYVKFSLNGASQVQYGYTHQFTSGSYRHYATKRVDRYGRETDYAYSTSGGVVKLTSMTDEFGGVTDFTYGTGANINKIVTITDPHDRTATFTYDVDGMLASITDAEGIVSEFTYDVDGFMTVLTTPYGDTEFENVWDDDIYVPLNVPARETFVTHPDGSEELFMYRDENQYLNTGAGSSTKLFSADSIAGTTVTLPGGYSDYFEDFGSGLRYRNSWHWGRQQYAALNATFKASRDYEDLTVAEYGVAHLKHWLKRDTWDNTWSLSAIIGMERLPNPDGPTSNSNGALGGQVTWYEYYGQANYFLVDDFPFPRTVATKLSNGEVQFTRTTRQSDGQPTTIIESYTNESGTLTTREYKNTYSTATASKGLPLTREIKIPGTSTWVVLEEWEYNDTTNNPRKITDYYDANGDLTEYTYNTDGLLTQKELPSGLVTTYGYNAGKWLTSITDKNTSLATMRTRSYTYDNGQVKTYTDPLGMTRTYTYDDLDRLENVAYPDSSYEHYTFDKLDIDTYRDRMGFTNYFTFNNMRQLTETEDPEGNVTSLGYCECGSLSSVTNALSEVTYYDYDYNGNLLNMAGGSGATAYSVDYDYFTDGRLNFIDDGKAKHYFTHNNQGIRNVVKNSTSTQISKLDYNYMDHPVKITRANKGLVNQTFDASGRLLTRTQADGGLETLVWGDRGLNSHAFKETASVTQTTTYGYDELYRRTSITNANSEVTGYTYNAAGQILTLTDGAGQDTTWVYNTYGDLTTKKDDNNTTILAYLWDDNHRMTRRWSKAKGYTYYTYDDNGNLTFVNYPSGTTDITYAYDDLNRLSSMVDGVGTTAFGYNNIGRLATENGPWASDTLTYTYTDRYRTKASQQQTSGTWVHDYTYDANGRLDTVVSGSGTFDYDYVGASRDIDDLTLPSSRYIDYVYDGTMGRLQDSILKMSSGGAVIKKHNYAYNKAGWKTDHTIYSGATVDRDYGFDYDNIGQLTFADDDETGVFDFEYAYDDAHNLDVRYIDEVSENFSVNNLNEVTHVAGQTTTRDTNGNLTYVGRGDNGWPTYTYNHENQLTSVRWYSNYPNYETKINYTYDGLGRLRKRVITDYYQGGSTGTDEIRYLYDGRNVIQERNSSNSVLASYTRGNDLSGGLHGAGGIGGLLARNWSSNNAFYHSDAMGNVTTLINSSGTVMASYDYDPFGFTVSQSGSWADSNPYRFSSKEIDESGMYYYGFRFYHPDYQRWMNRDPLFERGGINLYGFVGNRPLYLVDPYGLNWFTDGCSIAGSGVVGALQGAAVNVDELIPFIDPFRDWAYDPNDSAIQAAQKLAAGGQAVLSLGGKKLLQEGAERALKEGAELVAKRKAARAARREAQSRAKNGQNLPGSNDRLSPPKPSPEICPPAAKPSNRHGRERSVGID